jgi:hypothetical protein
MPGELSVETGVQLVVVLGLPMLVGPAFSAGGAAGSSSASPQPQTSTQLRPLQNISATTANESPRLQDEGQERMQASYHDNYARLVAVKTAYDRANLFHLNQNIEPAI